MAVLVTILTMLVAASSEAASVRVPEDYFGINFQHPYRLAPETRDRHLDSIASAGVTEVRLPVPWEMIEPRKPDADGHHYLWDAVDSQIAAFAVRGLRAQVMFAYAPPWASSATQDERHWCRSHGAAGLGAGSPVAYAKAAAALAQRYGPGGSFWAAAVGVPEEPVRVYEIWNSPNNAGAWCPEVDPGGYAAMFVLAAEGIGAIQGNAQVVVGGVGTGPRTRYGSIAADEFLSHMVATKPSVKGLASAVAIHAYPERNPDKQLDAIPKLRRWIRDAGFHNSTPMLLNEIGFSRVGSIDFTENQRVEGYANIMSKLPRTNCNISGVLPYTWTTREEDPVNAEDWFGIAKPNTALLYPSGRELFKWVDRFRGRRDDEAPRNTLMICDGMPRPDQDRDGIPDEEDAHPLQADDPGGGGGGGGGGDPGGACTVVGTPGDDVLIGARGPDVICGKRGDDVVSGGRGRDLLRGGGGGDLVRGGAGGDLLSGGRGRDALSGGRGYDVLRGGRGLDRKRQ